MPSEYTRRRLAERFYAKAHPDGLLLRSDLGQCWGWTGWFDKKGYACLHWTAADGTTSVHASRLSWVLHVGEIPAGLLVCHKCDNPACTRPDHLFLGTIGTNNRDMWRKRRGVTAGGRPGERNPNAQLTDAEVTEIRRLYALGGVSQGQLAKRFHCSQSQVSNITLEYQRMT